MAILVYIGGYELHSREESWPPAERRRQTVGQWAREGERWRWVTVAVSSGRRVPVHALPGVGGGGGGEVDRG